MARSNVLRERRGRGGAARLEAVITSTRRFRVCPSPLTQFEQAVEQGTAGRRTHVGASAELEALAEELVRVVRLMDGANRYRFADDADSLAGWESTSNVIGPPRSGGQAVSRSGGQVVYTGKAADGSKGVDHAA